MNGMFCVLRHQAMGRLTLAIVVRRTTERMGVIYAALPQEFRFLEGLTIRTRAGWYQARKQEAGGSTWLNPWLSLVRVAPGKYELLWEVASHGR